MDTSLMMTDGENNSDSMSSDEQKRLKEWVDNVNSYYKANNEHIERGRNFLSFLYVDQWDYNVRQMRESMSKPTLTFNKLVTIIRSILGEQRENTPALTVRGIGENIPQQAIDLRAGLLRQISYNSNASTVYQTCLQSMIETGWGAAYVLPEYENPHSNSLKQCLKIHVVHDFQAAFCDPAAQRADKSDGDFIGFYSVMPKDTFKKLYPDIQNPESATNMGTNYYLRWTSRETIVVAHYFYKDYFTKTIVQLSDGNELEEKDAKEILDKQDEMMKSAGELELLDYEPLTIVKKVTLSDWKIKYAQFIENKILDEKELPCHSLPMAWGEGDSRVIDNERVPLPLVQDAIDTQKMINYVGSEIAYAIQRSRKETIIGTPENFAGYEQQWRNPDQVQGALYANPDPVTREMPMFQQPPVMSPQLLDVYQGLMTDLTQVLGRYDEFRGDESNAISGRAINARQQASKKQDNVYVDNLNRLIKQIGKVCLEMMPAIYDSERTVMMMGEDGVSKPVTINKNVGIKMDKNGNLVDDIQNDMSYGDYDVEVRVDGSYDAQQAQALDMLLKLAAINPAIANLIPDLMAEVSGLENTQKLVERLKTLLPPQIVAQEEGKPMPPPPPPQPDPQVMIEQMKMQVATQQNQIKQQELELKQQELMLKAKEMGLNQQVDMVKAQAEVEKAQLSRQSAVLDHANTMEQMNHDTANRALDIVQQAEQRRATLAEQSKVLKESGI